MERQMRSPPPRGPLCPSLATSRSGSSSSALLAGSLRLPPSPWSRAGAGVEVVAHMPWGQSSGSPQLTSRPTFRLGGRIRPAKR
eukprot:10126818-Alexandrium_andersonii.AAC.1